MAWPTIARQRWRELLFVHWDLPAERVRARLPPDVVLDTFEGRAWLGLVAFGVEATRPAGLPRSVGLDFAQVDVRTYVRTPEGPAIWILRSAVDNGTIARLGRAAGLPVQAADVRHVADPEGGEAVLDDALDIRWANGAGLGEPVPGSLEHFLLERYVLLGKRGHTSWTLRVRHPAYLPSLADVGITGAIAEWLGLPAVGPPTMAHRQREHEVELHLPRPVREVRPLAQLGEGRV